MTKKFMVLGLLAIAVIAAVPGMGMCVSKGNHYGETKQVDGTVEFINPTGTCVASANGLDITINGMNIHLSIVYNSEYWGSYPVYAPNTTVPVKVTIANNGPRAVAKHDLVIDAYAMNTDGSNGAALMTPSVQTIEVALGETKVIDGSFLLPSVSKALNRFSVKLYHHYNADSPDASLVIKFDGVFCPPELLELASIDLIIDADGTLTPLDGLTEAVEVQVGDLLTSWPTGGISKVSTGLIMMVTAYGLRVMTSTLKTRLPIPARSLTQFTTISSTLSFWTSMAASTVHLAQSLWMWNLKQVGPLQIVQV